MLKEIRNPDDRLVCRVDEHSGNIEILAKGWLTQIVRKPDGTVEITHHKKPAA